MNVYVANTNTKKYTDMSDPDVLLSLAERAKYISESIQGITPPDESDFDEIRNIHISNSCACKNLVKDLMARFSDYLDLRALAVDTPFFLTGVVPLALSYEGEEQADFTVILNWISDGLVRLSANTPDMGLEEVSCLQAIKDSLIRDLPDSVVENEILPSLFANEVNRNIFLFRHVFTDQLGEAVNKLITSCSFSSVPNLLWEERRSWKDILDEYSEFDRDGWEYLCFRIKDGIKSYEYTPCLPIRNYVGLSPTPDEDECNYRLCDTLDVMRRGYWPSHHEVSMMLEAVSLNHNFEKIILHQNTKDLVANLAAHGSAKYVPATILDFEPYLSLIKRSGVSGEDILDAGLLCLTGVDFSASSGLNTKDIAEKVAFYVDAWKAENKRSEPALRSACDLLVYLLLKSDSDEIVKAFASIGDDEAYLCYELTGKSGLLKGIKKKSLIDRAFSADLGL